MQVNMEWVDARERLPRPGEPVAAATFGTWPHDFHDRSVAGEHYWLVSPMVFHDLYIPMTFQHQSEDDSHYHDCFVDSDGIIRYPPGGPSEDHITHWAALPFLPGMSVHVAGGPEAGAALRRAREATGHR
ncbi:AQJ64_40280 family protein [Streptomyces sp. NPDC085946]|uniref:AQJ64_40280 family protein n=1 Tax=Streptomyces sp. NPDC085946 TaxID=3365744 RepID=UPI0037D61C2D